MLCPRVRLRVRRVRRDVAEVDRRRRPEEDLLHERLNSRTAASHAQHIAHASEGRDNALCGLAAVEIVWRMADVDADVLAHPEPVEYDLRSGEDHAERSFRVCLRARGEIRARMYAKKVNTYPPVLLAFIPQYGALDGHVSQNDRRERDKTHWSNEPDQLMRIERHTRRVPRDVVELPQCFVAPVAVVRRDVLYLLRRALALIVVPPRADALRSARQRERQLDLHGGLWLSSEYQYRDRQTGTSLSGRRWLQQGRSSRTASSRPLRRARYRSPARPARSRPRCGVPPTPTPS